MKPYLLFLWALPLFVSAAEYRWVFDRLPEHPKHVPGQTFVSAKARLGIGRNGTGGLVCDNTVKNRVTLPLNCDEWTVSFDVKLDPMEKTARRGLFAYEFQDWNRSRFLMEILPDGKISAAFLKKVRGERKRLELYFEISSIPLVWNPGQWYHLRFGSQKGGQFRIERDGILVAGKNNAPALSSLDNGTTTRGYPLVSFGCNPVVPKEIRSPLFGVIDNITITDQFVWGKTPAGPKAKSEPDVPVSTGPKRLFVGPEPVWSGPFDVLDQKTETLGVSRKADRKYLENAGRASIAVRNGILTVEFDCPVPSGVEFRPRPEDSLWKECAEFFICPEAGKESGFHYAVGANGKLYAARMLAADTPDPAFVSAASAQVRLTGKGYGAILKIPLREIGLEQWQPGDAVRGNFTREGKSCGGLAVWAPVGNSFYNPPRFGSFILGKPGLYLKKQLDELVKYGNGLPDPKNFPDKCSALRKMIETDGNRPDQTEKILHALALLRQDLVTLQQQNRKILLWKPQMWRNDMEVNLTSAPLETITLSGPQNSVAITGFALSNLTDKPFMGQIKLMSGPIDHSSSARKWFYLDRGYTPFMKRAEFYEGLPLQSISGMPVYDALAPLPLNTLVRIPPRTTVPLWLRIPIGDTKPGIHKVLLALKPAYQGFKVEYHPVELNVLPVDLNRVFVRNYVYTYFDYHKQNNDTFTRFLAGHGVNMIFENGISRFYRGTGKDGRLNPADFSELDLSVSRYLAAGVPADRLGVLFFLALNDNPFRFRSRKPNPESDAVVAGFLRLTVEHLTRKFGLKPENLVFYPVDEPWDKANMFCAEHYGRLIRKTLPQCRTMVNPRKKDPKQFAENLHRLCKVFDIIQLYRPRDGQNEISIVRKYGRTLWYYHIMNKESMPDVYRRFWWENFRDGADDIAAFWHLESMAGGDGFDPWDSKNGINRTDYGAVYADYNFGTVLTSRRMEAWLQGLYDYKIAKICRELLAKYPDPVLAESLRKIVREAIAGDYEAMDSARLKLIRLIHVLEKRPGSNTAR